jgi:integrase/recombinase XerD
VKLSINTFDDYIQKYILYLAVKRNLSQKSIKAYFSDLTCFMKWWNDGSITEQNIHTYFEELMHANKLKDTSVKRKHFIQSPFPLLRGKTMDNKFPHIRFW